MYKNKHVGDPEALRKRLCVFVHANSQHDKAAE